MFRRLFLFTNILVALLLAVTYLIPYINPLQYGKIPLIGLLYPLLLVSNVGFLLNWLFFRRFKYAFVSFLAILLGGQHLTSLVGIPYFQKELEPMEEAIKVSSYNIHEFESIAWKNNSFQPAAIKNLVKYLGDTDYLCAQEMHKNARLMLQKELNFPYTFGNKGTRIFSRKPFIREGTIVFEDSDNSCTWVDVPFGATTVRLYSIHLESNRITDRLDKMVKKKSLSIKERLLLLPEMFRRYLHTNRLRVEQTEQILEHIATSPHPVVVCGDFNDSPLSYIYRKFTNKLTDGFIQKGKGLGTTFRGYIPLLRIDYIMADTNLQFQSYQVVRTLKYSDHYPTTAIIGVLEN